MRSFMGNFRIQQLLPAIVFVCLVLTLEICLSNLYWSFPDKGAFEQRIKENKALVRNPNYSYDVLFFGDSTGKEGVAPLEFDKKTAEASYNFSISAYVAPIADLYLLKGYLDSHHKPQAIYVIRSIFTWGDNPVDVHVRQNFENVNIDFYLFKHRLISIERLLVGLLANVIPSYAHRFYLQHYLSGFSFEDIHYLFATPIFTPNPYRGFTAHIETATNQDISTQISDLHETLQSHSIQPTQENALLLRYLCNLGKEKNIPIFLVASPHIKEFDSDRIFVNEENQLTSTLAKIANESGCNWIPSTQMDRKNMRDHTHTNSTGALIFTDQLAKVFNESVRSTVNSR